MTDALTILAHAGDPQLGGPFNYPAPEWQKSWAVSQPSRHQMQTCSHCGSLNPLDLLEAFKANPDTIRPYWADWKYGWPHKLYVDGIPNELAGQTVESGSRSHRDETTGEIVREPIMGEAPAHCFVKFYSDHFRDLAGRPEFDELARLIEAHAGIHFAMDGDKLMYRRVSAPKEADQP